MARKSSIRCFQSRGAYFTTFQDTQERLGVGPDYAPTGPTFTAALGAFKALMAGEERPGRNETTIKAAWDDY